MCGICGIWRRDGFVAPDSVITMRDSMAHRGPDGASGVLLSSTGEAPVTFRESMSASSSRLTHDIAFAHRRLAIIDLIGGDQPMASRDGSTWLVYNGELYNYRELRHRLAAEGHDFRTESDTEVVLRAYEHYGVECPNHFNGIFAFAVWDTRASTLFMARDHLGVKPLYYAVTPQGMAFASEVKAILASKLVSAAVDLDSLGLALTFRYTPSPATLFRGIHRLPPGTSLIVNTTGVSQTHFASSPRSSPDHRSPRDWAAHLALGIDHAVHRQMVSDVPIGLSLSSGVDSSTLLALMSRWSPEPVRAFTIGFSGSHSVDEVTPARQFAEHYSAQFQAREIRQEEYEAFMRSYMWHLEEPLGNESAPAYFFVAEMARDAGVKVLLTGQGPDELFAGYDRHVGIAFSRLLGFAAAPRTSAVSERLTRGRAIAEKYARFVASVSASTLDRRLLGAYTVFSEHEAADLLRPEVHRAIDWSLALRHVAEWLGRAPPGTPLEQMLWIDTRTLLSDNLLLAEDKMAMAASVEARVPFLDLDFVRMAESVPGSMKLRFGRRKHVYRQACSQWVGSAASRRRKIGFANPMSEWFRGSYQDSVMSRLSDPGSFLATYTSPDRIRAMVAEHRTGQRDHTRKLYFLASLDAWHSTFCE